MCKAAASVRLVVRAEICMPLTQANSGWKFASNTPSEHVSLIHVRGEEYAVLDRARAHDEEWASEVADRGVS